MDASSPETEADAFTVAFRVDASTTIGTGHLMRCLAVADALALRRVRALFLCRHVPEALAARVTDRGHRLATLPAGGPAPEPTAGLYGGWLGTTEAHDAAETVRILREVATGPLLSIVVDHYGLGHAWEAHVASAIGAEVAAIDDLDRAHAAGLVLDANFGKDASNYAGRVPPDCRLLIGPDHALLRPDFARERPGALARHRARLGAGRSPSNVLVAMGGADPGDVTGHIVRALEPLAARRDLMIHALVGAAYPHNDALGRAAAAGRVVVHRDIEDVARLLCDMDICIGAAGTSTWERCCLGLPTLSLVTAENQAGIGHALARAGIVADGGIVTARPEGTVLIDGRAAEDWVADVFEPFLADIDAQARLSDLSARIVDGFGVVRFLGSLFSRLPRILPVELAPVSSADAGIIFAWQTFPGHRRYSRSPEAPGWQEHVDWLERKIRDDGCVIRLIRLGGIPAGMIRLDATDLSDRLWPEGRGREVSIIVAPELQGSGVAARGLQCLLDTVLDRPIVANVSKENLASIRLFSRCGFVECAPEIFVRDKPGARSKR